MAASPLNARLPSPPPMAEDQIGPKSPMTMNFQPPHAHKDGPAMPTRRIRPGTKAVDMAEGPPMVPLNEINSAFQHAEYLKARYYQLTHPSGPHSVVPLDPKSAQELVEPPPNVNRHVWLYELCRFLCQKTNLLVIALLTANPPCSNRSCNEMRASEWQYLCAVHNPPKPCSAIDYSCHTLDWAVNTLTSPANFPSRMDIDSDACLSTIFRRVYRVFAHSWFQHNDAFWKVESVTGLYTLFFATCAAYKVVPDHHCIVPPNVWNLNPEAPKPHHAVPVMLKRKTTSIMDSGAGPMGPSASVRMVPVPRAGTSAARSDEDLGGATGNISTSSSVVGTGTGGYKYVPDRPISLSALNTNHETFPSFSGTEEMGELPTPEAAHWAQASMADASNSFIFSPDQLTLNERLGGGAMMSGSAGPAGFSLGSGDDSASSASGGDFGGRNGDDFERSKDGSGADAAYAQNVGGQSVQDRSAEVAREDSPSLGTAAANLEYRRGSVIHSVPEADESGTRGSGSGAEPSSGTAAAGGSTPFPSLEREGLGSENAGFQQEESGSAHDSASRALDSASSAGSQAQSAVEKGDGTGEGEEKSGKLQSADVGASLVSEQSHTSRAEEEQSDGLSNRGGANVDGELMVEEPDEESFTHALGDQSASGDTSVREDEVENALSPDSSTDSVPRPGASERTSSSEAEVEHPGKREGTNPPSNPNTSAAAVGKHSTRESSNSSVPTSSSYSPPLDRSSASSAPDSQSAAPAPAVTITTAGVDASGKGRSPGAGTTTRAETETETETAAAAPGATSGSSDAEADAGANVNADTSGARPGSSDGPSSSPSSPHSSSSHTQTQQPSQQDLQQHGQQRGSTAAAAVAAVAAAPRPFHNPFPPMDPDRDGTPVTPATPANLGPGPDPDTPVTPDSFGPEADVSLQGDGVGVGTDGKDAKEGKEGKEGDENGNGSGSGSGGGSGSGSRSGNGGAGTGSKGSSAKDRKGSRRGKKKKARAGV